MNTLICPEGYKYRREFAVPGGCINNAKRSQIVDPRCPTGMHWRKEHLVKERCVRKSKIRLKKLNQALALPLQPTCDTSLIEKYWTDHLKLILASVPQIGQNPIQPEIVNKIRRRFIKSLQKKLQPHKCEFRPTEEENLKLYNFIINTSQNVKNNSGTYMDTDVNVSSVVTSPALEQTTGVVSNATLDMDELYHLYFLFEMFNKLPNATLTGRGRELFERYNYLFNQLALFRRKQKQPLLTELQLRQYIKNYGESQLDPVSRQELEEKYIGPFWTQDVVTIHCPHCNHLVQVTHYTPNTIIHCPFCQGTIRLE